MFCTTVYLIREVIDFYMKRKKKIVIGYFAFLPSTSRMKDQNFRRPTTEKIH